MIFYFTGTDNSKFVANKVSGYNSERLINIGDEWKKNNGFKEYTLEAGEMLGFVFPVYAWAPPKFVMDFIKNSKFIFKSEKFIFAICTCGDEAGNSIGILKSELKKRSLELNSGYSVTMPNNYIVGFDVDSKEVEKRKIDEANKRLEKINENLKNRKYEFDIFKGSMATIKSLIVSPLFNKFAIKPEKFTVSEDCVGCKICENECPLGNIKIINDRPEWEKNCSQCLACIHKCPNRAIEYGKGTKKKGRYVNNYL